MTSVTYISKSSVPMLLHLPLNHSFYTSSIKNLKPPTVIYYIFDKENNVLQWWGVICLNTSPFLLPAICQQRDKMYQQINAMLPGCHANPLPVMSNSQWIVSLSPTDDILVRGSLTWKCEQSFTVRILETYQHL